MPPLSPHAPFCARRCSYCDFSIAGRKRVPAAEYVDAVLRELDWLRAADPGPTARGLIGNDTGPLLFEPRGTLKNSLSVAAPGFKQERSEEHTSELQSRPHLVCPLLLEKTIYDAHGPGDGPGVCEGRHGRLDR